MRYLDYICALLIRALNIIFHILPIEVNLWLGRVAGVVVYHLNIERRMIGYANLKAAFCKEKSPRELNKIIKAVYVNFGQVFTEILSLTKVNKKYIEKYITLENVEDKYKLANHPGGLILLTAHFGNWELSGMVSAMIGFPLVVLAREQKMKRLNELLNRLRESKGLTVVRKGITVKYIIKALREGKMIGMVGDQDAGKTGVFADFFGRPVSTAPGSARFAQATGAYILPAFSVRKRGPYHNIILEEPIKIEKEEDIMSYVEQYNKLLERRVRENPDQWLWLHRRWKSSPLKKVTVITDGKPGHINQALAVVRELKKYRRDSNPDLPEPEVKVVEAIFKSPLKKVFLNFMSLFAGPRSQGRMKCLEYCLTKESYDKLIHSFSNIIISCGSAAAGVNRLLSIESNAKSAVIMKPSFISLKKFDMAIIPVHDGIKEAPHGKIITVDTVPNLIDEEYMKSSADKLLKLIKKDTDDKKRLTIGVLLGGDNREFQLTDETTEALVRNISEISEKEYADILFTTSRRTPKTAEEIVKNKLSGNKRCKLLIVANENNIPDAVGGVLGLSDIVFVSGESVSMVSEAVSSGKRVFVFRLDKKRKGLSKFDKMMSNLEKKRYIEIVKADKLSEAVLGSTRKPGKVKFPEDRFNVYKYMWRLL